jgi:hypothetical protein
MTGPPFERSERHHVQIHSDSDRLLPIAARSCKLAVLRQKSSRAARIHR